MIQKKEVVIVNKATGEQTKGHQLVKESRPVPAPKVDAPPPEQTLAEPTSEEVHRQKSKKPKDSLSSLAALIEYAYSRKGQRIVVKEGELKVISSNTTLADGDMRNLQELATLDRLFAVPRQLLLFAREHRNLPNITNAVQRFVRGLLELHPMVVTNELQPWIRNLDGSPSVAVAFRTITKTQATSIREQTTTIALKPGEFAILKRNVIGCLAVWAMDMARTESPVPDGTAIRALCSKLPTHLVSTERSADRHG